MLQPGPGVFQQTHQAAATESEQGLCRVGISRFSALPASHKAFLSQSHTHAHTRTHGLRFHLVPYETGKYRFCLRLNQDKTGSRYVLSREVLWDLHVGHADTHSNTNLKEHDTQVRRV